jgi:hypothetical protein
MWPFLGMLGARATIVGVVAGLGKLLGYSRALTAKLTANVVDFLLPTNCATRGTLGMNRLLDHCRFPQAHLLNVGSRCVMQTSKKDGLK